MLKKFQKVLVTLKVPKYDAFHLEDINKAAHTDMASFISKFEVSKHQHEQRSHAYISILKNFTNKIDFMKVSEFGDMTPPLRDYDLVVTLGGDGTFLKTASYIDNETPILGLNTDSDRSLCSFCSFNPNLISMDPEEVWGKVFSGDYSIKKRTRIKFSILGSNSSTCRESPRSKEFKALNEIFFADKDVGKTSNFRLSVDGKEFRYYRSGGVIVSTGSGSSGWVRSARNVGIETVKDILEAAENRQVSSEEAQKIAIKVGSKYTLAEDANNFIYFVREPIMQSPCDYITKPYSGLANEVKVQSELRNGVLIIDGNYSRDVLFGDTITLTKSEKDLHCIHLKKS